MGTAAFAVLLTAAALCGCGSSTTPSHIASGPIPTANTGTPTPAAGAATSSTPTSGDSSAPAAAGSGTTRSGSPATETTSAPATTSIPTTKPPRGPHRTITPRTLTMTASKLCAQYVSEARSVGTVGPTANDTAATQLRTLSHLGQGLAVGLEGLSVNASLTTRSRTRAFLTFVDQVDAFRALAARDASTHAQQAYTAEMHQVMAVASDLSQAGAPLAPTCSAV